VLYTTPLTVRTLVATSVDETNVCPQITMVIVGACGVLLWKVIGPSKKLVIVQPRIMFSSQNI